jgi:Zn finger protein HypA/HybF involved in hydrogenase expression
MIKSHEEVVQKTETIIETVIDEITCNCCGKTVKTIEYTDDFKVVEETFDVKQLWGYHSEFDTQLHRFNVCQKCYTEWINKFVIPIDIQYDVF